MTTPNKDFSKSSKDRRQFIISLLQEGKTVTQQEIADWASSSTKTVRRDIDRLRNERWPIESGSYGYRLENPSSAEKKLSQNRMIATLLLTGGTIDRRFSKFAPHVADRIKQKILKMDDLADRHWDAELSVTEADALPFDEEDLERFGKLARHILNREAIRFYYTPIMHDEGLDREVFPVQLKERDGYWYLLGYDLEKQACRVFALSRIESPCISVQRHQLPNEETISEVVSRGDFSIWDNAEEKPQLVKVRLYEYAARLIQERKIHHSQELDVISLDEVILTLKTGDLLGVNLWLRKFAPLVEVMEPESLRIDFRNDLTAALERYE